MKAKKYLALLALLLVMAIPVQAAAAQTVYVVSSIKESGTIRWADGPCSYTKKVSYTDQGLIKKIKCSSPLSATYAFSYNSKNQLKKFTETMKNGRQSGTSVSKYTYKGEMLKTRSTNYMYGDQVKSTYKYKNGVRVSSAEVSSWTDEEGKTHTEESTFKASYQNGHVIKLQRVGAFTLNYRMDSKGNYTGFELVDASGGVIKDSYLEVTLKYNSKNGISKRIVEYKNPMMQQPEKVTQTIKYKKLQVAQDLVDMVNAQQWQLLNSEGVLHSVPDFCVAW